MGQCSTLPTEAGRNDTSNTFNKSANQGMSSSSRFRNKGGQMTESTSENSATPLRQKGTRRPSGYNLQVETRNQSGNQYHDQHHQYNEYSPQTQYPHMPDNQYQQQQQQQQQQRQSSGSAPQPVQEEREDLPPPPENAVRTRCYKLNLESEHVGIHASDTPRNDGQIYGPFSESPPPLTYSASEDSSHNHDATTVAIKTAQIFRGITVAKDGTILSQNARATRSNRGANKQKRGEKSRQAAKIDKAKDLVEEMIITGKAADDKDAQMVSLVIIGEYDEMKQLVRDGSKKLREATDLPDEALLSVNRPRGSSPIRNPLISPSRKRGSPFGLGNSSHNSSQNPAKSPTSKARHFTNNNSTSPVPPKLQGHPRDPSRRIPDGRQSSRRGGFSPMHDPCNDMFNQNADGDWGSSLGLSRGFNSIWNCGGTTGSGTMSPTQNVMENKAYSPGPEYSSPTNTTRRAVIEGRNETSYRGGMRTSERMEAPGQQYVHA